jgi:SAM-dependent methyltransferase
MKEEDIRKRDIFNRYLELAKADSDKFFADKSSFIHFNCFACGGDDLRVEFNRYGFDYVSCKNCATLFVNPRPSFSSLNDFYAESPATKFWINDFFKPVAEARRKKMFIPRAQYVKESISLGEGSLVGDIGAGFGIFLEELKKIDSQVKLVAIEPSTEQAGICKDKGLKVECCALEEIKGYESSFDLLTAFELLEHVFDPRKFLDSVRKLLKPKGNLLITTLNGQGFDIQALWSKSKSMHPPHHLNFFNPQSVSSLLTDLGFEVVEIVTPGKLDWDILEGMIEDEGVVVDRFWHLLNKNCDSQGKQDFQTWISKNKLSSHMRIIAKKI